MPNVSGPEGGISKAAAPERGLVVDMARFPSPPAIATPAPYASPVIGFIKVFSTKVPMTRLAGDTDVDATDVDATTRCAGAVKAGRETGAVATKGGSGTELRTFVVDVEIVVAGVA